MRPLSPRQAVIAWAQPVVDDFRAEHGLPALAIRPERPARPEHGDLALNLALQLAGRLKRPPLEIARELAARLPQGGPSRESEVAPPGFINLRLDPGWLFRNLAGVVQAGAAWGRSSAGSGKRIQVEVVSTNPPAPLLFSHGRGAVVGDTVARLFEFTGHSVEREFYINDAGRQVRLLAKS